VSTCNLSRDERASSFEFVLPQTLVPCDLLPQDLHMQTDAACHVVSTVLRKQANRATDSRGFARLKTECLRDVVGRRQCTPVMRALTAGASPVLTMAPYAVGKCSRGYKLNERFQADSPVRRHAVNPLIRARLTAVYGRLAAEQRRRRQPIDDDLERMQRRLTITADWAKVIDGLEPSARLCQRILVANIRDRRPSYSVSSTGRRFNAITGLKRELRHSLRLDGTPLASVDLVCAQPALLALLIRFVTQKAKTPAVGLKDVPSYKIDSLSLLPHLPACLDSVALDCGEVAAFRSLVCRGDFYSYLADRSGRDRASCKHAFLVNVLAKFGAYPCPVEDAFRKEFASVHAFVRAVNHGFHGELIRRLQRLEAWLVVETVAPRLVERIPIVTLHDAIFCRQGDEGLVESGFREVFGKLEFEIGMRPEQWGPALGSTESSLTAG
jgi:hypothetical protein